MKMKQLGWALALGGLGTVSGCTVTNCSKSDAGVCEDLFDDNPIEDDAATDADGGVSDASAQDDGATADDAAQPEDSSTADASSGVSISVEAFCEQLNAKGTAWRYKFFDECCPADLDAENIGYIEDFLAAHVSGVGGDSAIDLCVTSIKDAVTAGTLVYDGTHAEACVAAFVAQFPDPPATCPAEGFDLDQLEATVGHGAVPFYHFPECREALQGQVAVDAAGGCESTVECQGGLRCRSAPGETRACQLAAAGGGTCESTADCIDGYVCVGADGMGTRYCAAGNDLVLNGGNCSASTQCLEDLVCEANSCRPPMSYPLCASSN